MSALAITNNDAALAQRIVDDMADAVEKDKERFINRMLSAAEGSIKLGGADITRASVRARSEAGISYVPEDRHEVGLVLDFEFAGRFVSSALALGFQGLADRMVDDFVRTARQIYV